MRSKRNKQRLLLAVYIFICSLGLWCTVGGGFNYLCELDETLAELDTGDGRAIKITGETCWELNRSVTYEVKFNGKVISPRTNMYYDQGKTHHYSLIFAENRNLVGVIEYVGKSQLVAAAYDFVSGKSYPRVIHGTLIERLAKENPNVVVHYFSKTVTPIATDPQLPTLTSPSQ